MNTNLLTERLREFSPFTQDVMILFYPGRLINKFCVPDVLVIDEWIIFHLMSCANLLFQIISKRLSMDQ
jgi:DNA replication protein DnaC